MIELYEGVPGSGKSYHAICEKFLPWVRQGRRLYIAVDGIYLDRLALFTGIELETLEQQITIWKDSVEVSRPFHMSNPARQSLSMKPKPSFGRCRRSKPGLLRWLETHRHYGVDILLMSQDFRQMSQGVTRLIEATVKFRKLAFVGSVEKVSGQGARESRRSRDHPRLRRDVLAGDLRLLFELCVGGDPGRETQPYDLQVGASRDRHCGGPVCHWPHGLAALVVLEQHKGNSGNWSKWRCDSCLRSASASAPGSLVNPFGAPVPSAATPPTSEATGTNSRRGRLIGEPSRLALSLGQRRDPDGGADYRTVWPDGLGSLRGRIDAGDWRRSVLWTCRRLKR